MGKKVPLFLVRIFSSGASDFRRAALDQLRQGGILLSQKSDEQKPIRTDEAVSELANVSRDTIRKIERIEADAAPEVKVLAAAGLKTIKTRKLATADIRHLHPVCGAYGPGVPFALVAMESRHQRTTSRHQCGVGLQKVLRRGVHLSRATDGEHPEFSHLLCLVFIGRASPRQGNCTPSR